MKRLICHEAVKTLGFIPAEAGTQYARRRR
jgi:hypothetical protein